MCRHENAKVVAFNTGDAPLRQLAVPMAFHWHDGRSVHGARYCPTCDRWLPATDSDVAREFGNHKKETKKPTGRGSRSTVEEFLTCQHMPKDVRPWWDMQRVVCKCGKTFDIGLPKYADVVMGKGEKWIRWNSTRKHESLFLI